MTLQATLQNVDGWLTPDEAALLFELASACPCGSNILEIGSYHGRSTIALALGARQQGATVYAIDPHDPYSVDGVDFGEADNACFMRNLLNADVADTVKVINFPAAAFAKAWKDPIHLLFIDGRHDGHAPVTDYLSYARFVQQAGGNVAIHDSCGAYPEPTALVQRLVAKGTTRVVRVTDQLTVLEFTG